MGLFSGTLLISDIDGTLITYKGELPKNNIEAIEYYISEGGLFTLATGRGVPSARRYINKIVHNCPPVIMNGGAIYDFESESFLWVKKLPDSAKDCVKNIMEKFPQMGIQVYCDKSLYVIRDSVTCQNMVSHEKLEPIFAAFEDISDKDWNKVLCLAPLEFVLEMIEYLDKTEPDGFYFCRTQVEYYEIMAIGADKGNALKRLAEIKGIKHENTFAIGDYYNDAALIEGAGYSSYTENAPDELKKDADYISAHCSDGAVADFIEHLRGKMLSY